MTSTFESCACFVEYVFFECPNISDPDLALLNASKEGDYVMAELLVHCNETDVNALDLDEAKTPLYMASKFGYLDIVKLLVDHPQINLNVTTPLVRLFDDYDDYSDVTEVEWKGNCALQIASYSGHLRVVELLLQLEEIDVNEVDDQGGTALCYATARGHAKVVSLLIRTPG